MPSRSHATTKPHLTSEQIRELFKSRGLRTTRQREDIYKLMVERPTQHLSAEELFKLVRQTDSGISLATVYNTLEALEGAQLLRRICTAAGRARFDSVTEPHAHVVTSDGQVIDVPRDLLDSILEEIERKISPQLERRMGLKIDRATVKFLSSTSGPQFATAR